MPFLREVLMGKDSFFPSFGQLHLQPAPGRLRAPADPVPPGRAPLQGGQQQHAARDVALLPPARLLQLPQPRQRPRPLRRRCSSGAWRSARRTTSWATTRCACRTWWATARAGSTTGPARCRRCRPTRGGAKWAVSPAPNPNLLVGAVVGGPSNITKVSFTGKGAEVQ
jgi:hypothetical protein